MNTLESRIAKLETKRGITAERTAFQLDDATLERIIVAFLATATPEEIEATLAEHPEVRELFEELLPQVHEQREAVEVLIDRTPHCPGILTVPDR